MTATTARPPTDLDDRLDELIPPSTHPIKALLISSVVVGIAIVLTALMITGRLYPRPTFGASFSSSSYLEVDAARNAMIATISLPNHGSRSIRITDIGFDARGAELIDAGVVLEAVSFSVESSGDSEASSPAEPGTTLAAQVQPLPVTVAPGQWAELVVWFRPTDCTDRPGPWGVGQATVDFGDGAFPPFSNTFSIDQDPVAVVDLDSTDSNGGEMIAVRLSDGTFTTANGPLAASCEALR